MKSHLSDGEWILMKTLWGNAPMTITQLTAAMKETTGWSKHTIISMLSRLEAKGSVRHESNGRAKLFFPMLQQEDAMRREASRFLEKVFDGQLGVMLNTMMNSRQLTEEELKELSEIFEKTKEE